MSSPTEPDRGVFRFLDAFLQEHNIKWLLGVGVAILLGSSTMLVTTHWQSSPPLWKFGVMLAYAVAIHGAGQLAWHRLALRKTGAGLMALTVLLMPVLFLAFRWVHPPDTWNLWKAADSFGWLALLIASGVFATLASRRIFHHFLRGDDWLFLGAFLTLTFAGAGLAAVPAAMLPLAGVALWSVALVGALRVNRRIFWLTAEHRLPRICGYFPLMLLAGQYLLLHVSLLTGQIAPEWCGFGLVLSSAPVLLAMDASLKTSGKLPVEARLTPSVLLPLSVGLLMMATGMWLASTGFPLSRAFMPSATLAAVLLGLLAHRLQSQVLAWGMLLLGVAAYQTSPVFFQELARSVVRSSAEALQESRLPYAFYGLTYLPLLTVTTFAARFLQRRSQPVFATPLRTFSLIIPTLLLLASATHVKAMFLVGAALTLFLIWQSLVLRSGWLRIPAVASSIFACIAAPTFAESVFSIQLHENEIALVWLPIAALWLWPGRVLDRVLDRADEPKPSTLALPRICQLASLVLTLVLTSVVQLNVFTSNISSSISIGCVLLLVAQVAVHRQVWIAVVTLLTALMTTLVIGSENFLGPFELLELTAGTLTAFIVWGRFSSRVNLTLNRIFASAAEVVGAVGVFALQAVLLPVQWKAALSRSIPELQLTSWLLLAGGILLLTTRPWPRLTIVTWCFGFLTLSAAVRNAGLSEWPLAVWGAGVLASLAACRQLLHRLNGNHSTDDERSTRVISPTVANLRIAEACSVVVAMLLTTSTLTNLHPDWRIAGWLASGALGLWLWSRGERERDFAGLVLTVQGLLTYLAFSAQSSEPILLLTLDEMMLWLPTGLLCAISGAAWALAPRRTVVAAVGGTLLQFASLICIWQSLDFRSADFGWLQVCYSVATFTTLAAVQVVRAVRVAKSPDLLTASPITLSPAESIATAEFLMAVLVGQLAIVGVLPLNGLAVLFGSLGAWAVLGLLLRQLESFPQLQPLTPPLRFTVEWLPVATAILGIVRHVTLPDASWVGLNSLALLTAAAILFFRGFEQRRPIPLCGAAIILNIALAFLSRELAWSDPQVFLIPAGLTVLALVELLRERLPAAALDPLRYVGALLILVSPTFHIVEGSWLHLFTLMVSSILVIVLAMGLRIKALMYAGTAFLAADLVAMLVRGTIDHPSLLWVAGVLLGMLVIGLGAWCERNREQVLQRVRLLAATLETWN